MKLVLFLILVILIESCAIHKSFPFICFKGSCIGKQWHFRDIKNAGKNLKINVNQRKKKREVRKRKRRGLEEKTENIRTNESLKDIENTDPIKQDSVYRYKTNLIGSDTLIIISYKTRADSIIESYQLLLKKYFETHDVKKISEITLQEFTLHNDNSNLTQRMNILLKYLYELNIPKSLILVKSNKIIDKQQPNIFSEVIEIRIR